MSHQKSLRTKIGVNELKSMIMVDPTTLRENPPPNLRGGCHNILSRWTPKPVEGWAIILSSSHTWLQVVRWLICKEFLFSLTKGEKVILTILVSEDDFWTELLIQLQELNQIDSIYKKFYLTKLEKDFPLILSNPERYLHSYTPRFRVYRIWSMKVKLPPLLYIGVGYKDRGTLSSTPSWKEQMLYDGEGILPIDILRAHYTSFQNEVNSFGILGHPSSQDPSY